MSEGGASFSLRAPVGWLGAWLAGGSASRFRSRLASWLLPIGFFLLICLIWQITVGVASIPAVFLPKPTDVVRYIDTNFGTLIGNAALTGYQALLSLLLACLLGLVCGSLIFSSTILREAVYPILVTLQVLPKVALAPLFILVLGVGDLTRISFGCFLSFFPVLLSTLVGLEQTDKNALRLCRSLGASEFQTFLRVRVPFALPHIFAGLKVAATLAATGVVIGEFMTADNGLGFLIVGAAARVDSQSMFAAILMLCVVGLTLFALVVGLQKACRRWLYGK